MGLKLETLSITVLDRAHFDIMNELISFEWQLVFALRPQSPKHIRGRGGGGA
jgi:hypothetical protein